MLKQSINLAMFALLTAFATSSAAEQSKSETLRDDSRGYACIFAEVIVEETPPADKPTTADPT